MSDFSKKLALKSEMSKARKGEISVSGLAKAILDKLVDIRYGPQETPLYDHLNTLLIPIKDSFKEIVDGEINDTLYFNSVMGMLYNFGDLVININPVFGTKIIALWIET